MNINVPTSFPAFWCNFFLVSCRQIKRVAEISCSPWWDFNSHLILCWILTTLLNVSTLKRFCSSLGAELNHLPNASPRQHWKWSVCNQPVIYKVIPVNNQNMALTLQMKMRTLLQTKASFPAAMHRKLSKHKMWEKSRNSRLNPVKELTVWSLWNIFFLSTVMKLTRQLLWLCRFWLGRGNVY